MNLPPLPGRISLMTLSSGCARSSLATGYRRAAPPGQKTLKLRPLRLKAGAGDLAPPDGGLEPTRWTAAAVNEERPASCGTRFPLRFALATSTACRIARPFRGGPGA